MIKFDYRFSGITRSANYGDLGSAGDERLRELFFGDIIFKIGDCDFSAEWDWIPLFDFAVCLRIIVSDLGQTRETQTTFGFTESDDTIDFQRRGDVVTVSANYVECQAQVTLHELRAAVDEFSQRLFAGLLMRYPELKDNVAVRFLLPTTKAT